jgi:hypothetical protein
VGENSSFGHQSVKPGLGKDLNAAHENWGASIKEMDVERKRGGARSRSQS